MEEISTKIYGDSIPKAKSVLVIGKERTIKIELDTKFNKFQKKMWKYFFNIEILDIDDK